jgi:iron only hydrogenase large subunit-like protein
VNPLVLGKSGKSEEEGRDQNGGEAEPDGDSGKDIGASGAVKLDIGKNLEYEAAVPSLLAGEANLIRRKASSGAESAKVATISLNDCLACSGCVTSAETVLIQQQSSSKLLTKLSEQQGGGPQDVVVVAMSPQSIAAIASRLGISSISAFLRISAVLKKMGVKYVVDVASAADIALMEAREEFMARRTNAPSADGKQRRMWEKPRTSIAYSSTRLKMLSEDAKDQRGFELVEPIVAPLPSTPMTRPMIISSCPGWVCYAEKTQPEVIPYMSTVKSAQQILGQLLKQRLAMAEKTKDPAATATGGKKLFLVSIQPCFDKKLEASRLDFFDEEDDTNEIDLVLSTTELWEILEKKAAEGEDASHEVATFMQSITPDSIEGEDHIEHLFRCYSADGEKFMTAVESNRGSGGYLEYLMRYVSSLTADKESDGMDEEEEHQQEELPYHVGRNTDIAEVNQHGLKFAKIYGFRNIQSLMLKLKRGKCDYDFVEVMACPSGCLNGGGQLRTSGVESPEDIRQRVAATEESLHGRERISVRRPDDSPLAQWVYAKENLSMPLSDAARRVLHTRYHHVPKIEELAPLAATW